MTYFWMAPKDVRHNNWIFMKEFKDIPSVLRDEYKHNACSECGKFNEIEALRTIGVSSEIQIRSRNDVTASNDGVVCVSEKFKAVAMKHQIGNLDFVDIPSDTTHFVLLPMQETPTKTSSCGLECFELCSNCGRYEETCLFPRTSSMTLPKDPLKLISPDVKMESTRARTFWFLMTCTIRSILLGNEISGIDYHVPEARL